MENFNGNAEVEKPEIVAPVKNKNEERKKVLLGILVILGIAGVFILLTGKKKTDKKRIRIIKKTKTIVKNKKGVIDEETDETEDDNETDDNGKNDSDDSDNSDNGDDNGAN